MSRPKKLGQGEKEDKWHTYSSADHHRQHLAGPVVKRNNKMQLSQLTEQVKFDRVVTVIDIYSCRIKE